MWDMSFPTPTFVRGLRRNCDELAAAVESFSYPDFRKGIETYIEQVKSDSAHSGTADLIDASPETWHNHANAPSPQTSAHADPDELCRTRVHLQEEADPT
jgi:hypothetical protein